MISIWTLLAFSFFGSHSPQLAPATHSPKSTFAIRVDPSVKTEELQVRYFMTGGFGGLGGFQVEQDGENRILIHTEVEGKSARSLKAVIYAPHCRIRTISVDDLSQNARESEFHCTPVEDIKLQGKFACGPSSGNQRMAVEIQYLGFWAHRFFGIADGAVLTFKIAASSAEQDGSFQAYLPNLTESGGLSPQMEDASFLVLVRDAETGNTLAELKPPTSLSHNGNLKIISSYPQTIEFDAKWWIPKASAG
jgi:hypothetical protein